MQLTDNQRWFIMENFFKNEEYVGWRNIATKLLSNGKCIVAGNKCIWVGGIGNFIATQPAKDAVDCLEYTFDLKSFIKTNWFKDIYAQYFEQITKELEQKKQKVFEIEQLTTHN